MKLKPRHKAFMDKILHSPIHMICCARGKTEWSLEDKNGKQVPKKLGMGQEQDKQISYEYTVSLILDSDTHVASTDKDNTGIFDGRYEVLTAKHGKALYDWANSGVAPASTPVTVNNSEETVDVKNVITSIIEQCKAKGGTANTELMSKLKEFVPSGNPNAIKDIDIAKACLEAISNI